MEKIILTDIDEVLLSWCDYFLDFYDIPRPTDYNYSSLLHYLGSLDSIKYSANHVDAMVINFNSSSSFAEIQPLDGSVPILEKLKLDGYEFIAISSCGNSANVLKNRHRNLNTVFGKNFFREISLIPLNHSKRYHLQQFENSGYIWIEDNLKNYHLGETLGLNSTLMTTPYNTHDINTMVTVNNWDDLYHKIIHWYE